MSARVTLGPPGNLAGFPTTAVPRSLVRVCRSSAGTWFFCSDGSGRFDLDPPEGTCYLATDAYAAIREASRLGPVSTAWVGARQLRTVEDVAGRLAHTTHPDAGRYRLTNELATLVPYALPQQWAAAFRAAGLDGLRHLLRHDPRGTASGVSLFGPAGAPSREDGHQEPLTPEAVRAAGVPVLDPPHSAVLRIVE